MKIKRLISFFLAAAIMLSCFTVGAFATDADASQAVEASEAQATMPKSSGILSVNDLLLHPDVENILSTSITNEKYYGFSTISNKSNTLVLRNDGDDYYLAYGKSDEAATSVDVYPVANNSKANNYNVALKNAAQYAGKSFVVSVDFKLINQNNTAFAKSNLFQIGTAYRGDNQGSTTQKTYIGSVSSTGAVTVGDTTSAAGTVGTDSYTTLAVLVEPMKNAYSFYIDGELFVAGQTFATESNSKLFGPNGATQTGTVQEYMPSWIRFAPLTTMLTDDAIAFDNFKFYYADYYVECAEHNFIPSAEHEHDIAGNTTKTDYVCKNCGCTHTVNAALDANGDGKCDSCVAVADAKAPYHSFGEITGAIADGNGSIIASHDVTGLTMGEDKAGNGHLETDEWGNTYLSIGKTTDASKSNNVYHNFFYKNDVNFEKLKTNDRRGKSFVIQMDLRLEEGFKAGHALLEIATYVRDNVNHDAKSEEDVVCDVLDSYVGGGVASMKHQILSVNKNGQLIAGSLSSVDRPISEKALSNDRFTTVAVHVNPVANTYSVYMDGECVATVNGWLSWADIDQMTFRNADGSVVANGAEDYVLGYVRFFQNFINSTKYVISMDNFAVYLADDYSAAYMPKYHDYTVESITDGEGKSFALSYKCGECDGQHNVMAQGEKLSDDAAILSRSASLGESIGFKLYAEIGAKTANKDGTKMVLTVGEETEEYDLSDMTSDNGAYVFPISLATTEMTETITAKIVYADGESAAYTTTFCDYAEELIAATGDEELKALLESTLSLGAYAQDYFGALYGNEYPAPPEKYYDKATLEAADSLLAADYAFNIDDQSASVDALGATLVLDDKTTVKVFFSGEATGVTVNGEAAKTIKSGDTSYVKIEELLPHELGSKIVIVIAAADGSVTVNLSVLDLAHMVVTGDASDAFKNVARSLYYYCKCAEAYKA